MSDSEFDDYDDSSYEESDDSDDEITDLPQNTYEYAKIISNDKYFISHISDQLFHFVPADEEPLFSVRDFMSLADIVVIGTIEHAFSIYNEYLVNDDFEATFYEVEAVITMLKWFRL